MGLVKKRRKKGNLNGEKWLSLTERINGVSEEGLLSKQIKNHGDGF